MADATATFGIKLEDGLSANATKARLSIAALSTSLKDAKTKLAGYKSQLSLAKDSGNVDGFRKYSALVDQSKGSVYGLTQSLESMTSGLSSGGAAAGTAAGALGLVAVAAGVAVGAIAGLISITESLVVKSLEVVNANQQMSASFEALGGAGSGKKTLDMLNDLSAKLPQSREQLAEWTREIEKTGVTDLSKVRSELIATASAAAIMQDPAAAHAYLALQEKITHAIDKGGKLKLADQRASKALFAAGLNEKDVAARMGLSVAQLSAQLKAGTADAKKFGDAMHASLLERGKGPLDAMMNSLSVMGKKAAENLAHLFDGIDTKPLTDALRSLIALGDQGAPSGQAMKSGITVGLNGIIKALGAAITEAEIFFLTIELAGLRTYVALKPLIHAIKLIGEGMGAVGGLVGGAGEKAAVSLGANPAAAKEQGIHTGLLVVSGFAGPLVQMGAIMSNVVGSLVGGGTLASAHAGGVEIGKAAIAGVKEGTQTHSPSIAAMKIGMGIGEGLGMGMESSPAPARAARTISGNALGGIGGAKAVGAANSNAAGGTTSNVFHLNITAPDGVTDAQAISVTALATVLERYQIGSGR